MFHDDITLRALREARARLPAHLKGAITALLSGLDCGGDAGVLTLALWTVVDCLDEHVSAAASIEPALALLDDAIADLDREE